MKQFILFILMLIVQCTLAYKGITFFQWQWWIINLGYILYGTVYNMDFQRRQRVSMKVIYDSDDELYVIKLENSETTTLINTRDVVEAREEFVKCMTKLFNDTICEKLKDWS